MTKKIQLFRVEMEEYEPFEGKALSMLRNLLDGADSVHIYRDGEGDIRIVGEKNVENQ